MAGFDKEQRSELRAMLTELRQQITLELDSQRDEILATTKTLLDDHRTQVASDTHAVVDEYRLHALADMRSLLREELQDISLRLDRIEALVTRADEDLNPTLREIVVIKTRLSKLEQLVRTSLRATAA